MYAIVQEDEGQGHFAQPKKKGWAGWKPPSEDGKMEFRKKVMGANGAEKRQLCCVIPKKH